MRRHFEGAGFVEADPPQLQASPGNEAHLHAFRTERHGVDGTPLGTLYLHTSPEFALKKLLAAGEERPFAFAHVFRDREDGPRHRAEFVMLEWYRAGEPYERLMTDCADVLRIAAGAAGTTRLEHGGRAADPFAEPERLTVAEAFDRFAGIDLMATVAPDGATDADALRHATRAAGLRAADDDTWSDLFSKAVAGSIEPRLGLGRPTILCEYPTAEAALARAKPSDPRVAERFELYACGVELANGFGELTDAKEQRRRFLAEMDEKERVHGGRYPLDEDFLAALAVMPEASGIALGFDRLVMLATGAGHIGQVTWAAGGG